MTNSSSGRRAHTPPRLVQHGVECWIVRLAHQLNFKADLWEDPIPHKMGKVVHLKPKPLSMPPTGLVAQSRELYEVGKRQT